MQTSIYTRLTVCVFVTCLQFTTIGGQDAPESEVCQETLEEPLNGWAVPSDDYTFVQYFCDIENFSTFGKTSTHCTENNGWNDPVPICVPNECLESLALVDGSNNWSGFDRFQYVKTYCNVTLCKPSRKPTWNGEWGPGCFKIDCRQTLVEPLNGWAVLSDDEIYVNFYCDDDFSLSGNASANCHWNDGWDVPPPICVSMGTTVPTSGIVSTRGPTASSPNPPFTGSSSNGTTVSTSGIVSTSGTTPSSPIPTSTDHTNKGTTVPTSGIVSTRGPTASSPNPPFTGSSSNGTTVSTSGIVSTSGTTPSSPIPTSTDHTNKVCRETLEHPLNGWAAPSNDSEFVQYFCNVTFSPLGKAFSSCNESNGWMDPVPICVPNGCLETLSLLNDSDNWSGLSRFQYLETYCNTTFCKPDRTPTWNGFWGPGCFIIDCRKTLVEPQNGWGVLSDGDRHVDFVCDTDFILNGSESANCHWNNGWDARTPICVPIVCRQTLVEPLNGWAVLSDNDRHVRYFCRPEFNLIGPESANCYTIDGWDVGPPICVPDCRKTLVEPQNGTGVLSDGDKHVDFVCDTGFILIGPESANCHFNDGWDAPTPICVPIVCRQTLVVPQNGGAVLSDDDRHVRYYCDEDYLLIGPETANCYTINGWDLPPPICVLGSYSADRYVCGECTVKPQYYLWDCYCRKTLVEPQNGTGVLSDGDRHVDFVCDTGFILIGPESANCHLNEGWDAPTPICVPTECRQSLVEPLNGGAVLSNHDRHVRYYCDEDFILIGPETAKCYTINGWDVPPPICVPEDCGKPEAPIHGGVYYNATVHYGVTHYFCDVGYTVNGSALSVCTPFGNWSIPVPECIPIVCPDLGYLTNGCIVLVNSSTDFAATARYHCWEGYSLIGVDVRVCLDNGQWSGTHSHCQQEIHGGKLCGENKDASGTIWPETKPGRIVVKQCETLDANDLGTVSRNCTLEGVWMEPTYVCSRAEMVLGYKKLDALLETSSNSSIGEALSVLSNLTKEQTLSKDELKTLMSYLDTIVYASNNVPKNQSKDFFDVVDDFIDKRNEKSWSPLLQTPSEQEQPSAVDVLHLVKDYSKRISSSLTDEENNRTFSTPNLEVYVAQVDHTDGLSDLIYPLSGKELKHSTHLFLDKESLNGSSAYTAVLYGDLSHIVSPQNSSAGSNQVNTPVLGLVLVNNNSPNLTKPIQLTFNYLQDGFTDPKCSFLDLDRNLWSGEGCSLKSTSDNVTVCECNHLTNFAVLMSPWVKSRADVIAINVISYIGCTLSAIGLIVTVAIHALLWRYMRADRVYILVHLCVALVISYIVFLAGVRDTENQGGCTAVAIMLQYIYLVVFFLMLAEGIEIAVTVLYVFPTKSRLRWLLSMAWGVPAVIVGISMGATRLKGYGTDEFCWLSVENNLIWSFVAPALLIILANSVMLILVMRKMFQAKTISQLSKRDKIKAGIRCLCVLVPLMGCSWILGVFYVSEGAVWIQYIFALCNSLQGVVIFIFHCLFNEKIRIAMVNRRRRLSDSISPPKTDTLESIAEKLRVKELKNSQVTLIYFKTIED